MVVFFNFFVVWFKDWVGVFVLVFYFGFVVIF